MSHLDLTATITEANLISGDPLARAIEDAIDLAINELWHVVIDRNLCIATTAYPESAIEKLNKTIILNSPNSKAIVRTRKEELKLGDSIQFRIYTSN